jgi:hypothetical protein
MYVTPRSSTAFNLCYSLPSQLSNCFAPTVSLDNTNGLNAQKKESSPGYLDNVNLDCFFVFNNGVRLGLYCPPISFRTNKAPNARTRSMNYRFGDSTFAFVVGAE